MKSLSALLLAAFVIASCSRHDSNNSAVDSGKKNKSIFQQDSRKISIDVEKTGSLSPDNEFIRKHMAKFYSDYVPGSDCWMLVKAPDTDLNYCMEIKRVNDVMINNSPHKFVEINGLYVNHKGFVDPDNAPHVAGGKSGFYVFAKNNNDWQLIEKIVEFNSETWGRSGVDEKSFSQFGPAVHGWKISDGGMWQGQIYESTIFVAFINGKLIKILDFPITYNADGYGSEDFIKKNFTNVLEVDKSKIANNLYVLHLTFKNKDIDKNYEIKFDSKSNAYLYPNELPGIDY
jgi:hypothetical protein